MQMDSGGKTQRKQRAFDFTKYNTRHVALKIAYLGWDYQVTDIYHDIMHNCNVIEMTYYRWFMCLMLSKFGCADESILPSCNASLSSHCLPHHLHSWVYSWIVDCSSHIVLISLNSLTSSS